MTTQTQPATFPITQPTTTTALEAIDLRKSLPLDRTRIEILKGISLRIENRPN